MTRLQKQISNIWLIALVYFWALFRPKAKSVPQNPRTFLIVNVTENIGDMVCTTPVMRAIKQRCPDAKVLVLGVPKNKIMLEGNPDIDEYFTTGTMLGNISRLRKQKIDVGVMINPSALDFTSLFLAGVSSISCFTFKSPFKSFEARSYRVVSQLGLRTEYEPGKYVPRQYLKLLAPYGFNSDDIQKHLRYTDKGRSVIDRTFRDAGISAHDRIVAIAPSAGTKIKQWPADRFAVVANHLSKTYGFSVALIGGPNDKEEVARMKVACEPGTHICDFSSATLDELKAVLDRTMLIIGNDSGPIYIAEAFGKATVVLVGPTDELEHPLNDATHRIVMARKKGEGLLQSNLSSEDTIDHEVARAQIESISVADVICELDKLFKILKIEPVT